MLREDFDKLMHHVGDAKEHKEEYEQFLAYIGQGAVRVCHGGAMHGHTIEELIAHFARAASSSMAASKEVMQPADETDEPEDAEGIGAVQTG